MIHTPDRSPSRCRLAPRPALLLSLATFPALSSLACAATEFELPNPRRLIIYSGARLAPAKERMEEVDAWVREQMDSITLDPSFMIYTEPREGPVYPWEELRLNSQGDTAHVGWQAGPGGGALRRGPYLIYAHLHLMAAQNRLDRWLPEAMGADDFELEKAILTRVADAWLYQRSIFDARPYGILDEITYANEHGFLDELLLTARAGEFVAARKEWRDATPDGSDAFVDWFRRTFERDPPGYVNPDR